MKRPSALLQGAEPVSPSPPRRGSGPVVERVAGWSARHRKTALFGWLLLVAGAVMAGSMLGTKNLNSYDPGQAGRAERVLSRPGVVQPASETVLIQARSGTRTVASDPEIRRAIGQVTAALGALPKTATGIESPLAPGGGKLISRDGRSALVMFNLAGNPGNSDQTVVAAERAVAAVQAAHRACGWPSPARPAWTGPPTASSAPTSAAPRSPRCRSRWCCCCACSAR